MLRERRLELVIDMRDRKRDARADAIKDRDVLDEGELSEAYAQEELGFALMQMTAETLNKIAMALRRLEEGAYGICLECRADIPEARLRALPFAVRCKACEEAMESAERFERIVAQRRQSSAALFHMSQ
ncbi:MAG: TraR/DksA family transcriptional regulator [Thermoanaerobaculia bacterium]